MNLYPYPPFKLSAPWALVNRTDQDGTKLELNITALIFHRNGFSTSLLRPSMASRPRIGPKGTLRYQVVVRRAGTAATHTPPHLEAR